MLQRAASNSYSWWWASHIRSKQSKWLEQNIQDMEKKVQKVLKMIQEDGDSFAKRAEMYYKKRPELINFVEETYRAYRSLAERYDHISTELQNANNAIASVFPEQVQFSIEEEDRSPSSKSPRKILELPKNIPKVPQLPTADFSHGVKKSGSKKIAEKSTSGTVSKPVVSRADAMEEIEKLQKQVLGLQTEKEFVKSSYETGLAKFWEIEQQIEEMQGRIFSLQDEFGEGVVMDDEEARSLMARTALKSCEETLTKLEEKQGRLVAETKAEAGRIKDVGDELESIKGEPMKTKKEVKISTEEKQEPEFESSSSSTVAEMAEKIDEIVNKVMGLETAVLMHNALVDRLRIEIDELKAQIRALKNEKETLINRKIDASGKIEEMERKYDEILDLKQRVENQNERIQLHFKEAHTDMRRMSEKLSGVKPKEGPKQSSSPSMAGHPGEAELAGDFKQSDKKEKTHDELQKVDSLPEEIKEVAEVLASNHRSENDGASAKLRPEEGRRSSGNRSPINKDLKKEEEEDEKKAPRQTIGELLNIKVGTHENESEARAKIFLSQFSTTPREEDEPVDSLERKQQIKELKISNAMKDEEIKSLRQKLRLMNRRFNQSTILQDFKPDLLDIPDNSITLAAENKPSPTSVMEEKLRIRIDELREENLDFWLKCSTTFPEIQRFETEIQDLQAEILKLEEKGIKLERSSSMKYPLNFTARPLYKHLQEIQAALIVWQQKNTTLKNEQQSRLSSLSNLEEEITASSRETPENESFKLKSHEAAKFHGEVWEMKQENKKVAEEIRAGNGRITKFQLDVERTLAKLDEDFQLSGSKKQQSPRMSYSLSRNRVPLRLFIFGHKPKKQMSSLFSCMSPSMNRKYHALGKGS